VAVVALHAERLRDALHLCLQFGNRDILREHLKVGRRRGRAAAAAASSARPAPLALCGRLALRGWLALAPLRLPPLPLSGRLPLLRLLGQDEGGRHDEYADDPDRT
jgi:hypothetical protein